MAAGLMSGRHQVSGMQRRLLLNLPDPLGAPTFAVISVHRMRGRGQTVVGIAGRLRSPHATGLRKRTGCEGLTPNISLGRVAVAVVPGGQQGARIAITARWSMRSYGGSPR